MKNVLAEPGLTGPQEQTGEREWSWEVLEDIQFRRLSTVFGCETADAAEIDLEFFQPGGVHPDFPYMRVDDGRSTRSDKWSGITFQRVDYLGASTAAEEALLFTPKVTTFVQRYSSLAQVAGGAGNRPASVGLNPTLLPILQVVHVHRESVPFAAYLVNLEPPRPNEDQEFDTPFYDRRQFVLRARIPKRVGNFYLYKDLFIIPRRHGIGTSFETVLPTTGFASFAECTPEDTFQDRLKREAIVINDYTTPQTQGASTPGASE